MIDSDIDRDAAAGEWSGAGTSVGPALSGARARTSVRVAQAILQKINDAALVAGDPLPSELELARQLGVGRGSLREALLILELNGFVTIRAGAKGGPVVSSGGSAFFGHVASMHLHQSHAELSEVLQARVAFEPLVARLAAAWQDPGRMAVLAALIEESEQLDIANARAYTSCAERFHQSLASLSGNRVLDLFGGALQDLFDSRIGGPLAPIGARARIIAEHVAIGRAIMAGDAAAAEQLMRSHIEELASEISALHPHVLGRTVEWR
jgi:DNA-binding FadR family transcriptional regulator